MFLRLVTSASVSSKLALQVPKIVLLISVFLKAYMQIICFFVFKIICLRHFGSQLFMEGL